MATSNDLPPDPLNLLRKSIATDSAPTPSTSDDPSTQAELDISLAEATFLVFNFTQAEEGGHHVAIPISQKTRFESKAAAKAVDLRSVYFTWQNKDLQTIGYINAVTAINEELKKAGKQETVTSLSFQERTDLVNWLQGDIAENACEFIRSLDDNDVTRKQADDAAALVAGGDEDVEMRDAGLSDAAARKKEEELLRAIYAAERKLGDRNTLLRGSKAQDYTATRERCAKIFLKRSSTLTNQPNAAPVLTNNPALRPPVKAPQPGRRPEPIILLSPSASSLLRMPNIKSFLVDGIYQPPDSTTSSGANILHLQRRLSDDISKHPVRFILVDSPEHFRHDYWERVVAVFTTGQTWQFKNYKWQNPADLFANALGIYVGWKGEVVPETVKGWGRGVLTVQVDKGKDRWRDREVVEDIWRAVDGKLREKGWAGK